MNKHNTQKAFIKIGNKCIDTYSPIDEDKTLFAEDLNGVNCLRDCIGQPIIFDKDGKEIYRLPIFEDTY